MIVDMKVDFDAKEENVVDCDAFYLILIKKIKESERIIKNLFVTSSFFFLLSTNHMLIEYNQ
jgi:hypothetical protein